MNKLIIAMIDILTSCAVFAGASRPVPLTIDLKNRVARGDMIAARSSRDDSQYIGCGVRRSMGASSVLEFAFCLAETTDSNSREPRA